MCQKSEILTTAIANWGRAWIMVHSLRPHLPVHSILLQIVENGSSYPLCTFHNIFPVVTLFFFPYSEIARPRRQQANWVADTVANSDGNIIY
jgi:hypothetical protein